MTQQGYLSLNDILHSDPRKIGEQVLKVLSKKMDQGLPGSGLIAGQAVTSALCELMGHTGNVVYNDIDLFVDISHFKLKGFEYFGIDRNSACATRLTRQLDNARVASGKSAIMKHGSSIFKRPTFIKIDPTKEGYSHMSSQWVNSTTTLGIYGVDRQKDVNYVIYSGEDGKKHATELVHHFDLYAHRSAYQVLDTFDLNSVKCAVDISSCSLIIPDSFKNYLKTSQVSIDFMHAGPQTLIRFLDKVALNGNYGDIELAKARTYLFCLDRWIQILRFEPPMHFLKTIDEDFKFKEFDVRLGNIATKYTVERIDNSGLSLDSIRHLPCIGNKYAQKISSYAQSLQCVEFLPVGQNGLMVCIPGKAPDLLRDLSAITMVPYLNDFRSDFLKYSNKAGCIPSCISNTGLASTIDLLDKTKSSWHKKFVTKLIQLNELEHDFIEFKKDFVLDHPALSNQEKINYYNGLITSTSNSSKYIEFYRAHKYDDIMKCILEDSANINEVMARFKKLKQSVDTVFGRNGEATAFGLMQQYHKFLRKVFMDDIPDIWEDEPAVVHNDIDGINSGKMLYIQDAVIQVYNCIIDENAQRVMDNNVYGSKKYISFDFVKNCFDKKFYDPSFFLKNLDEYLIFLQQLDLYNQVIEQESLSTPLVVPMDLSESWIVQIQNGCYYLDMKQYAQLGVYCFKNEAGTESLVCRELITRWDLKKEGNEMSHCVGGYSDKVESKVSKIFALALIRGEQVERSTCEFGVQTGIVDTDLGPKPNAWFNIIQNRGIRNKNPEQELVEFAQALKHAFADTIAQGKNLDCINIR